MPAKSIEKKTGLEAYCSVFFGSIVCNSHVGKSDFQCHVLKVGASFLSSTMASKHSDFVSGEEFDLFFEWIEDGVLEEHCDNNFDEAVNEVVIL